MPLALFYRYWNSIVLVPINRKLAQFPQTLGLVLYQQENCANSRKTDDRLMPNVHYMTNAVEPRIQALGTFGVSFKIVRPDVVLMEHNILPLPNSNPWIAEMPTRPRRATNLLYIIAILDIEHQPHICTIIESLLHCVPAPASTSREACIFPHQALLERPTRRLSWDSAFLLSNITNDGVVALS